MLVDLPLAELRTYQPPLRLPTDFDAFWEQTLAENATQPLNVTLEARDYSTNRVRVSDVRYDGFGEGTRVAAWLLAPAEPLRYGDSGGIPTLVVYHGYGGSRQLPAAYLHWALQGFRVLAVDTRGQDGDTPDHQAYPRGAASGHMTKGIEHPQVYYYRYVYMDCVRAVEVAQGLAEAGPILLTGGSQGGGLTLAVAALARERIAVAMPDVPYLCHIRRAVEVFAEGPYQELVSHWRTHPDEVERNFATLDYFDGMHLAPRVACPVLLSVALLDTLCPPSTGFAVYHHLGTAEKELCVYPYNGHEGGGTAHEEKKYRFVRRMLDGLRG